MPARPCAGFDVSLDPAQGGQAVRVALREAHLHPLEPSAAAPQARIEPSASHAGGAGAGEGGRGGGECVVCLTAIQTHAFVPCGQ